MCVIVAIIHFVWGLVLSLQVAGFVTVVKDNPQFPGAEEEEGRAAKKDNCILTSQKLVLNLVLLYLPLYKEKHHSKTVSPNKTLFNFNMLRKVIQHLLFH
uniref:Secreted protein n=2 Tax=Micrurus TaxID=8634 RepID=A0A2D4J8Y1_MICLE